MLGRKLKCPLCEGTMKYVKEGTTHIWKCDDCPAILFEYITKKDTENLDRHLERRD